MMNEKGKGESDELLRDQWNNWVKVMDRIKQDEQRWLSVAFLIFGGLFAVAIGKAGEGILPQQVSWKAVVGLLVILVTTHLTACLWVRQSLVLRRQDYRSMAQMFCVQSRLGWNPSGDWQADWGADYPQQWREGVTRPRESKSSEMWILSMMVVAVNFVASMRYLLQWNCPCGSQLIITAVFGLLSFTGLLWYWKGFEKLDTNNMQQLHREPPVVECRRIAKASSGDRKE